MVQEIVLVMEWKQLVNCFPITLEVNGPWYAKNILPIQFFLEYEFKGETSMILSLPMTVNI